MGCGRWGRAGGARPPDGGCEKRCAEAPRLPAGWPGGGIFVEAGRDGARAGARVDARADRRTGGVPVRVARERTRAKWSAVPRARVRSARRTRSRARAPMTCLPGRGSGWWKSGSLPRGRGRAPRRVGARRPARRRSSALGKKSEVGSRGGAPVVELILRREGDMLRVHVHLVDRAGCLARDRHRGDGRAPTRARGAEAATSDGGEGDGGRSRGGERAGGDPRARGRAARPARGGPSRPRGASHRPAAAAGRFAGACGERPRARARHHARSVCCSRPIRARDGAWSRGTDARWCVARSRPRPYTTSWRGFRQGGACGGRGRTKAVRTRSKARTLDRPINHLDRVFPWRPGVPK